MSDLNRVLKRDEPPISLAPRTPEPAKVEEPPLPDFDSYKPAQSTIVEGPMPQTGVYQSRDAGIVKDVLEFGKDQWSKESLADLLRVGRYAFAPESIPDQTKERIETVLGAQGKLVAKTTLEAPITLTAMASTGKLDDWLHIPFMDKLPIKNFDGDYFRDLSQKVRAKYPELSKFIEQKLNGEEITESPYNNEYLQRIWPNLMLNEQEQASVANYAEVNPLEAENVGQFITNSIKNGLTQQHIYALFGTTAGIGVFDLVYTEQMQGSKAVFEERGLEWQPEMYRDIAMDSAMTQSILEFAGSSVSLLGVAGKLPGLTQAKAIFGPILGGFGEGTEEYSQATVQDISTNKMLARYAQTTGERVMGIPFSETHEKGMKGFGMGFGIGTLMGTGQLRAWDTTRTQEAKSRVEAYESTEEAVNQTTATIPSLQTPEEIDTMVVAFAQENIEVATEAVEKADAELRRVLEGTDQAELYNLARSLQVPIKEGTKEELIEGILESKLQLPGYEPMLIKAQEELLRRKQTSNFNQHLMKWMGTGDIQPVHIPTIRLLLESILDANNIDLTIEEFFEEYMQLDEGEGFVDFNRMDEFFVWAQNYFHIDRADQLIKNTKKEPVQVPVEDIKKSRLPLVRIDQRHMDTGNIDYMANPVMIGTSKHGTHFLLDGYHRILKAIEDQAVEIPAYILTQEETLQIAEEGSPLVYPIEGEERIDTVAKKTKHHFHVQPEHTIVDLRPAKTVYDALKIVAESNSQFAELALLLMEWSDNKLRTQKLELTKKTSYTGGATEKRVILGKKSAPSVIIHEIIHNATLQALNDYLGRMDNLRGKKYFEELRRRADKLPEGHPVKELAESYMQVVQYADKALASERKGRTIKRVIELPIREFLFYYEEVERDTLNKDWIEPLRTIDKLYGDNVEYETYFAYGDTFLDQPGVKLGVNTPKERDKILNWFRKAGYPIDQYQYKYWKSWIFIPRDVVAEMIKQGETKLYGTSILIPINTYTARAPSVISSLKGWAPYGTHKHFFYGLGNIQEFIAEAFSDPAFQRFLDTIPATQKPVTTIWDRLLFAIRKLLGVMKQSFGTMLDQVLIQGAKVGRMSQKFNENFRSQYTQDAEADIQTPDGQMWMDISEHKNPFESPPGIGIQAMLERHLAELYPKMDFADVAIKATEIRGRLERGEYWAVMDELGDMPFELESSLLKYKLNVPESGQMDLPMPTLKREDRDNEFQREKQEILSQATTGAVVKYTKPIQVFELEEAGLSERAIELLTGWSYAADTMSPLNKFLPTIIEGQDWELIKEWEDKPTKKGDAVSRYRVYRDSLGRTVLETYRTHYSVIETDKVLFDSYTSKLVNPWDESSLSFSVRLATERGQQEVKKVVDVKYQSSDIQEALKGLYTFVSEDKHLAFGIGTSGWVPMGSKESLFKKHLDTLVRVEEIVRSKLTPVDLLVWTIHEVEKDRKVEDDIDRIHSISLTMKDADRLIYYAEQEGLELTPTLINTIKTKEEVGEILTNALGRAISEIFPDNPIEELERTSIEDESVAAGESNIGLDMSIGPSRKDIADTMNETLLFMESVYPNKKGLALFEALTQVLPDVANLFSKGKLGFQLWSEEQWDNYFKDATQPVAFIKKLNFGWGLIVNPRVPPGHTRLQAAFHELGHFVERNLISSVSVLLKNNVWDRWREYVRKLPTSQNFIDVASFFVTKHYEKHLWASEYFAEAFSYWFMLETGLFKELPIEDRLPDVHPLTQELLREIFVDIGAEVAQSNHKSFHTKKDEIDKTTAEILPTYQNLIPSPEISKTLPVEFGSYSYNRWEGLGDEASRDDYDRIKALIPFDEPYKEAQKAKDRDKAWEIIAEAADVLGVMKVNEYEIGIPEYAPNVRIGINDWSLMIDLGPAFEFTMEELMEELEKFGISVAKGGISLSEEILDFMEGQVDETGMPTDADFTQRYLEKLLVEHDTANFKIDDFAIGRWTLYTNPNYAKELDPSDLIRWERLIQFMLDGMIDRKYGKEHRQQAMMDRKRIDPIEIRFWHRQTKSWQTTERHPPSMAMYIPIGEEVWGDSDEDMGTLVQSGRKLPSGGKVLRGRLRVLPNMKYMLDIFKTGDFVTLAHEFAHLFQPFMSDDVREAVIQGLIKKYHSARINNKGLYKIQRNQYRKLWDGYAADPYGYTVGLSDRESQLLRQMHEFLAESFEAYLIRGTPPNNKLKPVFERARIDMQSYYQKIRKLPPRYQMVDIDLAKAFDRFIAGESAIPMEVQSVQIKFPDEQGIDRLYTLNKSRPQIAAHRILLRAMERGFADIVGIHEKLEQYTEKMLGKLDVPHKNAIALIKNRKQAITYMNKVDVETAKIQAAQLDTAVEKVRNKIKQVRKLKMPDDIRQLFDNLIEYLDVSRRSKRNEKRNLELSRAMNQLQNSLIVELQEIPEILRHVTRRQIQDMFNWQKRKLSSLSLEELDTLYEALEDLRRYNRHVIRQNMEARAKELGEFNKALRMENSANWRYKRGDARALTVGQDRLFKALHSSFKEELKSQLITMLMLGNNLPTSKWVQLAMSLVHGREEELFYKRKIFTVLRHIRAGISDHGVSTTLGNVKEKDRIPVQMMRKGKGMEEVQLSIGQLMMLYGWAQNPKAHKKLLVGIKLPEYKEEMFSFPTEEALYTALSQLDSSYKKIVDFMILYYAREIYPRVNETHKRLNYGISLPMEENYLPLASETTDRYNAEFLSMNNLNPAEGDWARAHILSLDFLHMRMDAETPVFAMDFFDMVGRNMNKVAFYIGMAEPITNMRIHIFGAKNQPGSAHAQLVKMIGRRGATAMEQWLNTVEDPTPKADSEFVRRLVRANAKVRTAYLNLSLSVLFIQPITARLCKAFGISEIALQKATAKDLATGIGLHSIKELMELSPFIWERYERIPAAHMELEGIDHRARRAWVEPTSFYRKLAGVRTLQELRDMLRRSEDSTLLSLMYFDSRALSIIYEACIQHGLPLGWSRDRIIEKFLEIVTQSQPMNDPLFVSNMLSNKSSVYKAIFGVFQSARDGIRRTVQRLVMQIENGIHRQPGSGSVLNNIRLVLEALVLSSALTALVQTMFRRIGRDDDDTWEDNFVLDWLVNSLTNLISLVPIAGTVLAGSINNHLRGWGLSMEEMPLMGAIKETSKQSIELTRKIEDNIAQDPEADVPAITKEFVDILSSLTVFYGSSWYNIDRQARKAWKEWGDPEDL
jgi:hypothetical protein